MVHRVALLIGGIGAIVVLSLAVALGGLPALVSGSVEPTANADLVANAADDGSDVRTIVDTVFIKAGANGGHAAAPTASPRATSSPQPTASPDGDDHRGGDDRHGDGDSDDDRSGRGHGDDDSDNDRSGHGHGDYDSHDDDRHRHGGDDGSDDHGRHHGDGDRHGDDD